VTLTVHSAIVHSATCDEIGAHIPAGYLYWASGQYAGGLDNFPLVQLLIALPVRALGLHYALFTEQHILLFRLPVVLLTLMLGLVTYAYTRDLLGRVAAWAAIALLAVSPNILAHGSLATLDLPTAFFILLALWLLLRYVTAPSAPRLLWWSLALALAVTTKVQALLLLPLAVAILLAERPALGPRSASGRVVLVATWLLLPAAAVVLVLCATYRHNPFPSGALLPGAFSRRSAASCRTAARAISPTCSGSTRPAAGTTSGRHRRQDRTGNARARGGGLLARPTRRTMLFILLRRPPSSASRWWAGSTSACGTFGHHRSSSRSPAAAPSGSASRLALAAPLLGAWSVVETAWVAPHYLSYFNELAGGTRDGHRVLLDSNYDWGQNDHFLRRYLDVSGRSCRIDPDPFLPTSGCVVVNANALYGILNGGDAAYRWLRERPPRDRVAYTWFVYDVPATTLAPAPDPLPEQAQRHLLYLRRTYGAGLDDPSFRLSLATALAFARAYREALEETLGLLARDPAFTPALMLGGELTVRRKLGVLSFEDDEYLRGFRPAPEPTTLDTVTLESIARVPTARRLLGETHFQLGRALAEAGRRAQALDVLRQGLVFDSVRDDARRLITSLESRPATQ
jgi:hypothetical protein